MRSITPHCYSPVARYHHEHRRADLSEDADPLFARQDGCQAQSFGRTHWWGCRGRYENGNTKPSAGSSSASQMTERNGGREGIRTLGLLVANEATNLITCGAATASAGIHVCSAVHGNSIRTAAGFFQERSRASTDPLAQQIFLWVPLLPASGTLMAEVGFAPRSLTLRKTCDFGTSQRRRSIPQESAG